MQEYALEMLVYLDMREHAQDFVDRVRTALVAGAPDRLSLIFKEWFVPEEQEQPDLDRPETIEWTMPSSAEEFAFVEEFVREHASGTISAAELGEGGGWE